MKKFIIFLTTILLFTCLLPSCSKEEEIRLLESITYNDGSGTYEEKYEYDNQNRITKISYYDTSGEFSIENTLIYNGNDLVGDDNNDDGYEKISYENYEKDFDVTLEEHEKNGNIIKVKYRPMYFHLNSDGNLIRIDVHNDEGNPLTPINYIYDQNGNLITYSLDNDIYLHEYEYDNKKAPFTHCNTPKWWMQYKELPTKNNIIKMTEDGKVGNEYNEYVYEYDDAEYPIKCTTKYSNGSKAETVYKYIFPNDKTRNE